MIKKIIDKFLKRNFKIKAFFLALSFFLWLYVMAEVDPIVIKDIKEVPVNIVNDYVLEKSDMSIDPQSDTSVSIILRGRRTLVKDLTKNNINVVGKISDLKEGENNIDVYMPDINQSINYTIIPNRMPVNIYKNTTANKSIQVQNKNELKEKYGVYNTSITPENTDILGPEAYVEKVESLVCKIDTTSKTIGDNIRAKILPIDKDGNVVSYVTLEDEYATIQMFKGKTKTVPIKINTKGTLSSNYKLVSVSSETKQIKLSGDVKDVESISAIETESVDLSNITTDSKISTKLKIPANLKGEFTSIDVKVDISEDITKEFVISKNRINFTNNIQNLDISKNDLPETIKVKLVFSNDLNANITEEDISLYVDLQEYDGQNSKFEIKCNMPNTVQTIEIEPKYVFLEQ